MGYFVNLFSVLTYLNILVLLVSVYMVILCYFLLSVQMKKKDLRERPTIPGEIITLRICSITYWIAAFILTVFPIYIAVPIWLGMYIALGHSRMANKYMDAMEHFAKATRYDPHPFRVVRQYLRLNKIVDRQFVNLSFPFFGSGGVAVFAFVAWLYGSMVYPKPLEVIATNLYLIVIFLSYFLIFLLPRKSIGAIVQPVIFIITLIIWNIFIF